MDGVKVASLDGIERGDPLFVAVYGSRHPNRRAAYPPSIPYNVYLFLSLLFAL